MNVIILDEEKSCLYMIKSLLLEQKLRVSTSSSTDEAKAKIETVLFDAAFIVPSPGTSNKTTDQKEFLNFIATKFPHIPVCIITNTDDKNYSRLPNVVKVMNHPIRSSGINEAITAFNNYIANFAMESGKLNREIKLPADVYNDDEQINCVTNNITTHSILIEGHKLDEFNTFFTKNMNSSLDVHITYDSNTILKLNSKVAFAELTPSRVIRSIGLSFHDIDDSQRDTLNKMLSNT